MCNTVNATRDLGCQWNKQLHYLNHLLSYSSHRVLAIENSLSICQSQEPGKHRAFPSSKALWACCSVCTVLFSPLFWPFSVAPSVSFGLHLRSETVNTSSLFYGAVWLKHQGSTKYLPIPTKSSCCPGFLTQLRWKHQGGKWCKLNKQKQLAKGALRKKEYGDPKHRRWEVVWGRRQQAGWGRTRRKLWTLPWSSGGEPAHVMSTEPNGGRVEEGGRMEWALHSAQRWRLKQRAGVRQRALCSSGQGTMGRNQPHVLHRKSDFTFTGPASNCSCFFLFLFFSLHQLLLPWTQLQDCW